MKQKCHKKLGVLIKKAAENASGAMSTLTGETVTVKIVKAEIKNIFQENFAELHPESIVAGIYLPITGDIHGSALLIFPEKVAYKLCDLLFRRSCSGEKILSELDKSALKEVGNIVCGSFLTVLSNTLKVKIIEHVPDFTFDMFGSMVAGLATEFAEQGLVIEITFDFIHGDIKGYVMLVFELGEMKIILKAMEVDE